MALSTGTISADFTLVIAGVESTALQGYADLTPSRVQATDGVNSYIISTLRCPIVDGVLCSPGTTTPNVLVTSSESEVSWMVHVEIPGYRLENRRAIVPTGTTLDYLDMVPEVTVSPISPVYATISFDTDGTPYLVV